MNKRRASQISPKASVPKLQKGSGEDPSSASVTNSSISIDALGIKETILNRVNDVIKDFKPTIKRATSSNVADLLTDLIPPLVSALATSVSVAVGEVLTASLREMRSDLNQQRQEQPLTTRLVSNVRNLSYENDRLQQYTRRENLRVFGVPCDPSESADTTEKKTIDILNATGAVISKNDISVCHRLGRTVNGSRPIIVRFVSRRKRTEVLQRKKALKTSHRNVYINDDLTPLRSKLLKYVKDLPSTDKVWTIDGKIMCSKKSVPGLHVADQPKPFVIETPDDLFKLGEDSVDYARLGLHHLADNISAA